MCEKEVEGWEKERRRLVVWFLFVAGVSVMREDGDEEMLVVALRRVLGRMGLSGGWEEVRDVLRGVMWIDWVHSAGGRRLWEVVVRKESGESSVLSQDETVGEVQLDQKC
jgi:hypothetical protein